MATSIFTLGRKSTTYSAPRYNSVCPFCRPKPLTSVTVIPCTPIAESASRTSSSLNGLMMAVTSFMSASEGFAHRQHHDAAPGVFQLGAGTCRQLVGEAVKTRIDSVAAALGVGV